MKIKPYLIFFVSIITCIACEHDKFSTNPNLRLSFSCDTMMFDTVFTAVGSATRSFKIYNNNNNDIEIHSISLAGGNNSPYRINVDGYTGPNINNIPIRAKDSLFIFVEVTVDPTSLSSPLLIADSIVFCTNTNIQDVKLVAWGQDVYLHNATIITTDTILTADKPHLIYDYIFGLPNATITIEPGAKLYFHNNAVLWVTGSLIANGNANQPIIFEGDRLEEFYRNKAGQWYGIKLNAGSYNNSISWTCVKNSIIGIQVDTCVTASAPTLVMDHSRIENTSYVGLLAQGATIEVNNCLFTNSAYSCIALTLGGSYRFYHCTIANYWSEYMYRKSTALLLNNYYLTSDQTNALQPRDLIEASFYNCIIYGSLNNEIGIDNSWNHQIVDAQMNYFFKDCIIRTNQDTSNHAYFSRVNTKNPKFKDISKLCFELDSLSPAKDAASIDIATLYNIDLNNHNRLADGKPDIGAFERIE